MCPYSGTGILTGFPFTKSRRKHGVCRPTPESAGRERH